ncbi:MAG: glycosyltransferase family 2 protein [Planctomycetota bacterium]|jgi:GT2 family glycosyltransferase
MRDMFVLIPTHGRTPLLERTLASLAACRRPDGYRATIVIENGSRAGAEQVVAAADPALAARYLHEERPNKSHALNVALRECPDAFVVFLDDDILLAPESLEAYAAARLEHPGRHFFGGPCIAEWEREPPDWLKDLLPASARGWSIEDPEGPLTEVMFLGFNWAAEAADVLEAGGFDPERGPGTPSMGQESDMMQRLVNRGWSGIYVPQAVAHHHVPWDRCSPEWAIARASRFGAALAHGCRLTGQSAWTRAAFYAICQPLVMARVAKARLAGDEAAATRAACLRNRRAAFIRETLRGPRRGPGASSPAAR